MRKKKGEVLQDNLYLYMTLPLLLEVEISQLKVQILFHISPMSQQLIKQKMIFKIILRNDICEVNFCLGYIMINKYNM